MSNKSHRLYIGATTDLLHRVREHKEKRFPNGFTDRYNFDRLVYFEVWQSYEQAVAREQYLKGLLRRRKVELIQEKNPHWEDLIVNLADLLMAQ